LNEQILIAIDEEIARLRQVRAILAGSGQASSSKAAAGSVKPRRQLSAKARNAIAEAQRKRWAKVNSLKKAAASTASAKKEAAR
jgi:hypothetical protein